VAELAAAIAQGDRRRLTAVRGVGAKTAERILLELRDRLPMSGTTEASPHAAIRNEALLALQALGFARSAVEGKLDAYLRGAAHPPTVEELIRHGLKS
jgi:Holliday junction DNA helicase RuvA